jgi:hypothetical protein
MEVENSAHSPDSTQDLPVRSSEAPLPCLPTGCPVERVDAPVRSSDLSDPLNFLFGDQHTMEV